MPTKSDQAYEHLRAAIISGAIEPDAPLRIQTVGEQTGFGSTPVREALRRLEAERLVVSAVNCGFRSSAISAGELKDLEDSRRVIETALLEQAIAAGGDAWESRIVAAHYQLAKLDLPFESGSRAAQALWSDRHQAFHDALLAAAPSNWLHSFQKQIAEQFERFFHFSMTQALRSRLIRNDDLKALLTTALGMDHHTRLMDATLDRDQTQARALLIEHLRFTSQFLAAAFPEPDS